jgi:hypothetical protein
MDVPKNQSFQTVHSGVQNIEAPIPLDAKEMEEFDISPYVAQTLEEVGDFFHKIFKELGIGR